MLCDNHTHATNGKTNSRGMHIAQSGVFGWIDSGIDLARAPGTVGVNLWRRRWGRDGDRRARRRTV